MGTIPISRIMRTSSEITIKNIADMLQRIPAEDDALWAAVRENQEYKVRHPDEKPERYESGTEFLKAMGDL